MARTATGRFASGGDRGFARVDRPPATPREVLARAAAERRHVEERVERLRQAIVNAREASMTALGVVDDAEAALAEAERGEQRRAVALALGEEIPGGPSVNEAQAAVIEAKRRHALARQAIASLEAGSREVAGDLGTANERVRNALVAVIEAEDGVKHLMEAYDETRARLEQIALALRHLGPFFGVSPGFEHPQRALPRHDASLLNAWRTALAALESGEVEVACRKSKPSRSPRGAREPPFVHDRSRREAPIGGPRHCRPGQWFRCSLSGSPAIFGAASTGTRWPGATGRTSFWNHSRLKGKRPGSPWCGPITPGASFRQSEGWGR